MKLAHHTIHLLNGVNNCYNIGEVHGKVGAGGICYGISSAAVTNCYNMADIYSSDNTAGGICGYASGGGYTNNSVNGGNIIAKKYAGGIHGLGYTTSGTNSIYYNGVRGSISYAKLISGSTRAGIAGSVKRKQ